MDDAGEGRQVRVHALEHRVDGIRMGHVRDFHLDPHTLRAQVVDHLLGGCVGIAAAVQHDHSRAVVRQPLGHHAADAAQAAGDQIGSVRAQPVIERRRGEDDLADMACRLHERHRCTRFRQRPAAVDQRLDFAGGQAFDQAAEDRAGAFGLVAFQDVEFDDRVAGVRSCSRHFVGGPDVASRQLHEMPAVGEAGQARLDEAFARQAVHDDVDAGAVGGLQDPRAEVRGSAVEYVGDADGTQERALGGARRGDHLGAGRPREFDGRQSQAAGTGMDQDPLARLEIRRLEGQRRGHEDARYGGQRRRRQVGRRGYGQGFSGHGLRSEGAVAQRDDAFADGEPGHVLADFDNPAHQFFAEQTFLEEPHAPEDVPEVEPGGFHGDPDLARLERLDGLRCDDDLVERAAVVGVEQPARRVREVEARWPVGRAHEPRHPASPVSIGDVRLGIGPEQLLDQLVDGRRRPRIEVDQPRLPMGCLAGHDLAEAPQRGADQFAGAFTLEYLGTPGQEPDSPPGQRVGIGETLRQRQCGSADAPGVLGHLLRGRVDAVTVQRGEMHHAVERQVFRQSFEQPLPRLPAHRVHRCRIHARPRTHLVAFVGARDHHRLVAGRETRREFFRDAAFVRR